mmetsp:Transcript_32744/g.44892  ORF Transcript_32744/g.44892 Transcript_32744/m.44892 type:complete len:283 (+) Transcript_32744:3584-4432(+)
MQRGPPYLHLINLTLRLPFSRTHVPPNNPFVTLQHNPANSLKRNQHGSRSDSLLNSRQNSRTDTPLSNQRSSRHESLPNSPQHCLDPNQACSPFYLQLIYQPFIQLDHQELYQRCNHYIVQVQNLLYSRPSDHPCIPVSSLRDLLLNSLPCSRLGLRNRIQAINPQIRLQIRKFSPQPCNLLVSQFNILPSNPCIIPQCSRFRCQLEDHPFNQAASLFIGPLISLSDVLPNNLSAGRPGNRAGNPSRLLLQLLLSCPPAVLTLLQQPSLLPCHRIKSFFSPL